MMIFWRHGLAMLSVPKTGTHAYQAAYGDAADIIFRHPQSLKHIGLRGFDRRIRPLLEESRRDIETMALIRDPLDWLGSWYRYRARAEIRDRPTSTAGMDFNAFVRAYLSDDPPPCARVGGQHGLLTDAQGGTVTHLFAYEAQDAVGAFLADRLKMPAVRMARVNVSPQMGLPLDDPLRDRLTEKLAPDYALYAAALRTMP